MATLLRYRSYGDQPFCEVMLENGDQVLISVDAGGVTIKREARRDAAEEILFLGPVHLVTRHLHGHARWPACLGDNRARHLPLDREPIPLRRGYQSRVRESVGGKVKVTTEAVRR
jgi:hypothetical protein